ncbi:hypothetical protein Sjap_024700 [Stephania japonica]|uniref:FAD-binding PCMH-type domain-containing protein n=1 Tax=Stephania japonica TaxID=461633 RepID=A0AAP0EL27_9MAGN
MGWGSGGEDVPWAKEPGCESSHTHFASPGREREFRLRLILLVGGLVRLQVSGPAYFQLRSINIEDRTAWVQAGATTGELYYRIAEKTSTLGFPGGLCPTVAVGGLISGGGYGYMLRKYGLAADNIVDAHIVNVEGEILNRETMGEDLFWAIRGGGGASFGVILSWKIKLVPVPSSVTIFAVSRTLEQGATELVHKWQYIAHKLPKELYIRVPISKVNAGQAGQKTIQAQFQSLFLGKTEQLLAVTEQSFPELNLKPEDCMEVSWFQTMLYFSGLPMNVSLSSLLANPFRASLKGKSDYVKEPISKSGLEGIWKIILEANNLDIALTPYGGIMSEISASALPFPHRDGNIYHIGYLAVWNEKGNKAAKKKISWIRKLYKYMKPFVSKSPRSAYLNYRDIDLGRDFMNGTSSYAKGKVWGSKYFGNNFDRLVQVKSKVDPCNFFRNEQGIPPPLLKMSMPFASLKARKDGEMETSISAILALFQILVFSTSLAASSSANNENFYQCLSTHPMQYDIPIYTPNTSSYYSILQSHLQNLLFLSRKTPKPYLIIAPLHESHVQAAVICCRKHGLQIKIRSGGHDYEGLSYISYVPFVILDMFNLKSISIDVEGQTAWVQAGATLGELYYRIAERTPTLCFPAGICPTVGVGGHFSGGGYGYLLRKYGLAADNIVDAQIVNVEGDILNRKSMGEDLFWAVRGGGGASFGVILSWKIKLVPVPSTVTIFTVPITLEHGATELVHKWQYIAHKLPKELVIRVLISKVNASQAGQKTILAMFQSLFLGGTEQLLNLMEQSFPELGLKPKDCVETSWFQSLLNFSGLPMNASLSTLSVNPFKGSFKGKSDYVKEPISEHDLRGIWKNFLNADNLAMSLTPYGGIMSEIPASEIPFPHREGNMYHISYIVRWNKEEEAKKSISWLRKLYKYMEPYVSKSPRSAYLNYRDIDLGHEFKNGTSSYAKAKVWGSRYFGHNFDRLVQVKSKVDPINFFRNEQGIPPV